MFLLDGRPLPLDAPFTTPDGTQYPSNWLRLASPEERAAIGIQEVADPPPPPDQRFYWGWDAGGQPIPKDHAQLVEQWSQQTRATANSLLNPTDWLVIREADSGTAMPADVKARREEIRVLSREKVAAIQATATTDALAEYITSPEYATWEPAPVGMQRARNADGTFVADDPATPDVNEAWQPAA